MPPSEGYKSIKMCPMGHLTRVKGTISTTENSI